jgi:hypothetical protein
VGQRAGNIGQQFRDQGPDSQLVDGIGDGPQQAHRHRFDAARGKSTEQPAQGCLVQRGLNPALGIDALGHFEGIPARYVRIWILHAQVVRLRLAALLEQQDIREPLRGQEGGTRDLAFDDAVGRARGAVEKDRGFRKQLRHRDAELLGGDRKPGSDTRECALAIRQCLADRETAFGAGHDDVREGSPGVDRNTIRHADPLVAQGDVECGAGAAASVLSIDDRGADSTCSA